MPYSYKREGREDVEDVVFGAAEGDVDVSVLKERDDAGCQWDGGVRSVMKLTSQAID